MTKSHRHSGKKWPTINFRLCVSKASKRYFLSLAWCVCNIPLFLIQSKTVKSKLKNSLLCEPRKLIYNTVQLSKQMVCFVQLRHSTIHYLCIKPSHTAFVWAMRGDEMFHLSTTELRLMALNGCVSQISPSLLLSSLLRDLIAAAAASECVYIINRNHIESTSSRLLYRSFLFSWHCCCSIFAR